MSENYSLEQQKLLIEALLSNRDLFAQCQALIKPDYFHKQYQKTIRFILEFAEKYKDIPSVKQLKSETGLDYELLGEISDEHRQYFLDELEKFSRHQALALAILAGYDMLEKNQYGDIEKLIKDALLVGLQKDLGVDLFHNTKETLLKIRDSNGKLSTGWLTVDQKIYNVNRKELLIFCAPSGGGKSIAMQNMAINMAALGHNTVYITLELKEELCTMRFASMISSIKSAEIFKKLDEVSLSVAMTGKKSAKVRIKKMAASTTTVRDIRAYLKEYKLQEGVTPDVIMVDYLDLMAPMAKGISAENAFMKDKFVSEELRSLGDEFDALVVTASQLNRGSQDEQSFNHSHIAGGISKINTADNVIGIYNTSRSRERGEIEFQFMKTRNSGGVDTKVTLGYNPDTLRIFDLDEISDNNTQTQSSAVMNRIKNKANIKINHESGEVNEVTESPISAAKPLDPLARAQSLRNLINKNKS